MSNVKTQLWGHSSVCKLEHDLYTAPVQRSNGLPSRASFLHQTNLLVPHGPYNSGLFGLGFFCSVIKLHLTGRERVMYSLCWGREKSQQWTLLPLCDVCSPLPTRFATAQVDFSLRGVMRPRWVPLPVTWMRDHSARWAPAWADNCPSEIYIDMLAGQTNHFSCEETDWGPATNTRWASAMNKLHLEIDARERWLELPSLWAGPTHYLTVSYGPAQICHPYLLGQNGSRISLLYPDSHLMASGSATGVPSLPVKWARLSVHSRHFFFFVFQGLSVFCRVFLLPCPGWTHKLCLIS